MRLMEVILELETVLTRPDEGLSLVDPDTLKAAITYMKELDDLLSNESKICPLCGFMSGD